MLDFILFAVLPYVVVSVELIVSIKRYFSSQYQFSSLSSEFLESKQLFWGSVPWHYGIIVVLLGHFFAFLFPHGRFDYHISPFSNDVRISFRHPNLRTNTTSTFYQRGCADKNWHLILYFDFDHWSSSAAQRNVEMVAFIFHIVVLLFFSSICHFSEGKIFSG
jgi:hypothetical protein